MPGTWIMEAMEVDGDTEEVIPSRRSSRRIRQQSKRPNYREIPGVLFEDDGPDIVFSAEQKVFKKQRGHPGIGEESAAMDVDKAVDLTEGRTPEEVEALVKEILKKLWRKKGLDYLNDPNHFDEDSKDKGTFDYSVYIMIDEEDDGIYIGTKAGRTDSPCVVWSRREDDFYYRDHDETAPFKYECSIVFKGNQDPYSSMAAAESDATFLRILQQVGSELRPEIYVKNKNIQQRLTGLVWSKEVLVQKLHQTISEGITFEHAQPPVNPFYPNLHPEYFKQPPKISKPANVDMYQVEQIVEQLLQRKKQYAKTDSDQVPEKNREETDEEMEVDDNGEMQDIPIEDFLSRLSLNEYDETEDMEYLERNFPSKLKLDACSTPETQDNASEPDEERIDANDPSHYSVYIMQNIETSAIYIGSRAGKRCRPCVIWKKVEGTRMYSYPSVHPGQLFVHIASFVWKTTSINYHEVMSAADAHAAYLQLLQTICHELNPNQYAPLVNQFLKIKPLVWTTMQLSKHLTEDLINGRTVLDAMIPKHPFIAKATRIDSVLTKSVFQPATLEDIEDGIADVNDALPLSVAAALHGLRADMLLAVIKLKNKSRAISTAVTMSEVTGALSRIVQNARNQILITASIELEYPEVPATIINRYATQLSKINRIKERSLRGKKIVKACCYFCKKLCTNLGPHMRTHTKEKRFSCKFKRCGKAFAELSTLKLHMTTHTKERPFSCKFEGCGKAFKNSANLSRHKKTHNKEKPVSCKFEGCWKAFKTSTELSRHMRTHTKEKPFFCNFKGCRKSFAESSNLTLHIRTHTKEKPFFCNFKGCRKSFSHSPNLKRHIRTHTKEKPFCCNFMGCGKKFSTSSDLSRHMRTHTKEKPFCCNFMGCGKKFSTSSDLSRHMITHSKEKKFFCNYKGCRMSFTQSSNLKRHMKLHNS